MLGGLHRQGRKKTLDTPTQMSRMTQESCRPRVSDRTMVGNTATRLACEFQRTKRRRHVSEHETTGTKKPPRPVAPRPSGPLRNGAKRSSRCRTNVAIGAGGLDVETIFLPFRRGEVFLLDIPFNRTSRSCGLAPPASDFGHKFLILWTARILANHSGFSDTSHVTNRALHRFFGFALGSWQ